MKKLLLFILILFNVSICNANDKIYLEFIKSENPRIRMWEAKNIIQAVKYYNPRYFDDDEAINWEFSMLAQESSFRNINGDEGLSIGYGMVQIETCNTARNYNGIKRQLNLHSLWDNIHCSMAEFHRLYNYYNDYEMAVRAYNAGIKNVNSYIKYGVLNNPSRKKHLEYVKKKKRKLDKIMEKYIFNEYSTEIL